MPEMKRVFLSNGMMKSLPFFLITHILVDIAIKAVIGKDLKVQAKARVQ